MPGETVLVADGDARSLRMLELALRRAGFAVETAGNGEQAARNLREARIQAAVCAVAIGEPDGLALCRSARADQRLGGIPFLLIGSEGTAPAKARAIEAGADEYLTKPVLLKELVQRLQNLLDRRRLSDPGVPATLAGSVRDLGLLDVFQSLESWGTDALVRCEQGSQVARVWVREGEIVDAELGPVCGEAAFFRLMTWEEGGFRVDFTDVGRREARIQGGTQAAVVEAMRRVDELGRIARTLPMATQLHVDVERLEARLPELPDEINAVLRHFDGARTLRAAIDLSPADDLAAVAVVQQLVSEGILRRPSSPVPVESWASPAQPAKEATRPRIVQFPPLRGMRRERLRREAEEARMKIAAGEPVRLHHVVELPARDETELLGGLRRLSPAVGQAARTFAPDASVSRVLGTGDRATEPPIAPVALTTPPPGAVAALRLRRRWPWLLGAAALGIAWTLRPQPHTERRDSPWLESAARGSVEGAAEGPQGFADAVARGNEFFGQGKYREAAGEYRKALAIRPDAVPVLVSLGDAWLEADQPRSALEPLEAAARLDPTRARAQLLLGTTYHSIGKIGEAAKAYRRYLELEPSGEFASDVKVILANLGPAR